MTAQHARSPLSMRPRERGAHPGATGGDVQRLSRRHEALPYSFPGRERAQVIRYGLEGLLWRRELERARAEAALRTRRDIHRSRDLRIGFGGHGAPFADRERERQRVQSSISDSERDVALEYLRQFNAPRAVRVGLRMNRWARGDWEAGRYVLTEQGLSRLAGVLFAAVIADEGFKAGLGVLPALSTDSAWILSARMYLTDDEIGQVLIAADNLGPGLHDERPMELELARAALSTKNKHGEPETERKKIDRLARIGAKRWARLREMGYRDTRETASH